MLLYSRNVSNYCFKTEWALSELDISVTRELNQGDRDQVGMAKVAQASPALITVPALDDHGFVLTESTVIVQYLVDSKGIDRPFFPKDPKQRARILQWDRFCDFEVARILGVLYYNSPGYLDGGKPDQAAVDAARNEFPAIEAKLESVLSKSKYMTSQQEFTYADVSLAVNVFFLSWFGITATLPGVSRWLTECTSRPKFKKRLELATS